MTAPTTPQPDWLDEAFDIFLGYTNAKIVDKHGLDMTKAEIRSRISEAEAAAELKGRIDELMYWRWLTDGHIEMSGKEVDRRISDLKARQADTSGREG